jgi:hypothetical protein
VNHLSSFLFWNNFRFPVRTPSVSSLEFGSVLLLRNTSVRNRPVSLVSEGFEPRSTPTSTMGDHGATPLELEAQVRLLTEQLSLLQTRLENTPATLPPTPRVCGVKARKPDQFTGESNRENVSQWLFESERYFTLSGTNPLEAIQYASSYLSGAAAIWWRSRVRQHGPTGGVGSWDGFVEALTAQFKPVNCNGWTSQHRSSARHVRKPWLAVWFS